MNKISIVAGGALYTKFLPEIKKSGFTLGVDRGALWLLRQGITPDIAIGDFDSVTKQQKEYIHDKVKKYIEYPPDKDATDLELAIDEAIKLKPRGVRIYGALGGRFDHSLMATNLLSKLESHNIYGEIVDNFNKINIVRHKLTMTKDPLYYYVSIIPLGTDATLTLRGFTYNASRKTFRFDSSLGISNEISDKSATIQIHKGSVLVVRSRD